MQEIEEYSDDEAWLDSPVCSECGIHPEEDEEHEEGCQYSK